MDGQTATMHGGTGGALAVVRGSAPHALTLVVGPGACFLGGRALLGFAGGVAAALAWETGCLVAHRVRRRPVPGLLVLGAAMLAVRALVWLTTRSGHAFFLVPSAATAAMGLVYVASGFTRRPLAARFACDLFPAAALDVGDRRVLRLCRAGSVLWGGEQIVSATVSTVMALNLSTTAYVALHGPVSWAIAIVLFAPAAVFAWPELQRVAMSSRRGLQD